MRDDDLTAVLEVTGRDCRRAATAAPRSLLCQTRSELQHARCRHASARGRYPICGCPCHHEGGGVR